MFQVTFQINGGQSVDSIAQSIKHNSSRVHVNVRYIVLFITKIALRKICARPIQNGNVTCLKKMCTIYTFCPLFDFIYYLMLYRKFGRPCRIVRLCFCRTSTVSSPRFENLLNPIGYCWSDPLRPSFKSFLTIDMFLLRFFYMFFLYYFLEENRAVQFVSSLLISSILCYQTACE